MLMWYFLAYFHEGGLICLLAASNYLWIVYTYCSYFIIILFFSFILSVSKF